jgi:hypothetical protein
MRQVGVGETTAVEVSLFNFRWHQNRGVLVLPGWAWRVSAYWPGGARHRGGVNPACGFHAERGKAHADTAVLPWVFVPGRGREGARTSGMTREALSTEAARAGGPARSSGEPAVMAGERRGRVIRG